MRKMIVTVAMFGAMVAAPFSALAWQAAAAKPAKAAAKPAMASHVTTGTVKSMDASSLVIVKPGKKAEEVTFVINPSTQHQGAAEVGTMVTVRYHADGASNVATAVVAKPAAKKASK